MSNSYSKQAISIIFLLFSLYQPALADQIYTQINPQNLEPSISCDQTLLQSMYDLDRIPSPSHFWEENLEETQAQTIITQHEGGIIIPEGRVIGNVLPILNADAFIIDETIGAYALILPSLASERCVLYFYSTTIPQWADRTCVSYYGLPDDPFQSLVETCPVSSVIARYSIFISSHLRNTFYFPSPVTQDSFSIDQYDLLYFHKLSNKCQTRNLISPGIVSLDMTQNSPFSSILFTTPGGRSAAIFADQCTVTISAE